MMMRRSILSAALAALVLSLPLAAGAEEKPKEGKDDPALSTHPQRIGQMNNPVGVNTYMVKDRVP